MSPIKVTMMLHRKDGVSEQDFHEYWTKQHSKVVNPWLKRNGVIKYTQFHTPSWHKANAVEAISGLTEDRFAACDGFVELIMPNADCFERAMKDPYYEEVVKPDEGKFADLSRSQVLFGWEEKYIEEGEILV